MRDEPIDPVIAQLVKDVAELKAQIAALRPPSMVSPELREAIRLSKLPFTIQNWPAPTTSPFPPEAFGKKGNGNELAQQT